MALANSLFDELNATIFGNRITGVEIKWNPRFLTTAGRAKWHKYATLCGFYLQGADMSRRSTEGVQSSILELSPKVIDSDGMRDLSWNDLAFTPLHNRSFAQYGRARDVPHCVLDDRREPTGAARPFVDGVDEQGHARPSRHQDFRELLESAPKFSRIDHHNTRRATSTRSRTSSSGSAGTAALCESADYNCTLSPLLADLFSFGRHTKSIKPENQMCPCSGRLIAQFEDKRRSPQKKSAAASRLAAAQPQGKHPKLTPY